MDTDAHFHPILPQRWKWSKWMKEKKDLICSPIHPFPILFWLMAAKMVCADPAFWRAHLKAAKMEEKLSVVCFRSVVSPLPKKVCSQKCPSQNSPPILQCADRIAPSQRPSLSANLFWVLAQQMDYQKQPIIVDGNGESEEHRQLRRVAFFSIVISTAAVIASIVTLPMLYSYVRSNFDNYGE